MEGYDMSKRRASVGHNSIDPELLKQTVRQVCDLLDQREIAARLGISRWRVVELKARALDKLRAYFQVAREGQP